MREFGAPFSTEEETRVQQIEEKGQALATPDLLFATPIEVQGRSVAWIDAKNFYGSSLPGMVSSIQAQVDKYATIWGSGMIVFSLGCAQSLQGDIKEAAMVGYDELAAGIRKHSALKGKRARDTSVGEKDKLGSPCGPRKKNRTTKLDGLPLRRSPRLNGIEPSPCGDSTTLTASCEQTTSLDDTNTKKNGHQKKKRKIKSVLEKGDEKDAIKKVEDKALCVENLSAGVDSQPGPSLLSLMKPKMGTSHIRYRCLPAEQPADVIYTGDKGEEGFEDAKAQRIKAKKALKNKRRNLCAKAAKKRLQAAAACLL